MDSILIPSVCIALLVALLAGVVHPILTKRHVWLRATGYKLLILQLTERKEQLYASIKELEFDHSLGKISEEDYAALRGDLEAEAVAVLQKLDTVAVTTESEEDLDARIEADITAQRAVASAPSKGAAPAAAESSAASMAEYTDA